MIIPEFIFRTVIVRGITTLRENIDKLDQLFRNLDQESAQQMRTMLEKHRISLDINYPREPLKLPAVVILLRSEEENTAYLGDSMGSGEDVLDESMSFDSFDASDLSPEILGGAASVSTSSGEGTAVFGPTRVKSATSNTITADGLPWKNNQYLVGGHTLHIVGGASVGYQGTITANGQNTIMVTPNFKILPDSTSIFVVKDTPIEVVGEPRALYDRNNAKFIERKGGLYSQSHQVQIIAQNPELTIYLHAILKAIFTASRSFMEGQGIINMKMSATDFVARAEYQPDHSYMRAMNIEYLYPFDTFVEMTDIVKEIRTVLEVCQTDGISVNVSDTTTVC